MYTINEIVKTILLEKWLCDIEHLDLYKELKANAAILKGVINSSNLEISIGIEQPLLDKVLLYYISKFEYEGLGFELSPNWLVITLPNKRLEFYTC